MGAWHFAHSFVRGHWGNSKTSTPMIVAKCCHDMDILYWLMGRRKCLSVASFGELTFFTKKNALLPPAGTLHGLDHPGGEDPWDARKYATDDECKRWLGMVYDRAQEATAEEICEWLETSPVGQGLPPVRQRPAGPPGFHHAL